jgi:hypothetical protein
MWRGDGPIRVERPAQKNSPTEPASANPPFGPLLPIRNVCILGEFRSASGHGGVLIKTKSLV